MIKMYLKLLWLCLIISGCKKSPSSTDGGSTTLDEFKAPYLIVAKQDSHRDEIGGVWRCYRYERDIRYNEAFTDDYAKEFSRFACFEIRSDSILISNRCKALIYSYNYAVKFKKLDIESTYITHLKPKADSIRFITVNPDDEECADPFQTICNANSDMILHDRGYFFYFKKTNEPLRIKGIPGDNRNEWTYTETFRNSSFQEVYAAFLKKFPYGAKDLQTQLPARSETGNENLVSYEWNNSNTLTIRKPDPFGIITIRLAQKSNNEITLLYQMEYTEN
ncbi:MAG TPA: hypothetical protein VGB50_13655 [Flavobacterium sp.]|jgi:hypothetical protein